MIRFLLILVLAGAAIGASAETRQGPVRVLFLGHDSERHNARLYYPKLAQALGREAIYFDYVDSVDEALGDASYLNRFDALLLYANHDRIEADQWSRLKAFVENGGGFVAVHCASWCFQNEPEFARLLGGRFRSHGGAVFAPRTVRADHPALAGVPPFEAWDETYVHDRHNVENRVVLQERDPSPGETLSAPEPWTWIRTQGRGRVFYTASGPRRSSLGPARVPPAPPRRRPLGDRRRAAARASGVSRKPSAVGL